MIPRNPCRSAQRPPKTATKAESTGDGVKAKPTLVLLYAHTSVRKRGQRNQLVNAPSIARVTAILEILNDLIRNKPGSKSGSGGLDDLTRKRGSRMTAPRKQPMVSGETHPHERPWSVPKTTRKTEPLPIRTPRRSRGLSMERSAVSLRKSFAPIRPNATIGTRTK